MTNLRRNYSNKKSAGFALRLIIFTIVLLLLLFQLYKSIYSIDFTQGITEKGFFLPSSNGEIVQHKDYTLSYLENHEQAEWVAYKLTKDNLLKPNFPRSRKYRTDPKVSTGSAFHKDFSNSGFTRGHLAPAGDMAHDQVAMKESFYMSNMSPQLKSFNNGIWKELEETVRDWTHDKGELIVVTGPIFGNGIDKIGRSQVTVPISFYKILLHSKGSKESSVAFVIPNRSSDKKLSSYVTTIDEIENITGIDFFYEYLDEDTEARIESMNTAKGWSFSEKKYNLRVNKWNRE